MSIYTNKLSSIYNNIKLNSSYKLLYTLLDTNKDIKLNFLSKYKVFILSKSNYNNIFLRIEKKYNYISTNYKNIGFIDIINKNDNSILIDSYNINNNKHNLEEYNEIKQFMFDFAMNIAKDRKCNKINLDVHENLNYYKKDDLEKLGFNFTNKKAIDNPYWITTTKYI